MSPRSVHPFFGISDSIIHMAKKVMLVEDAPWRALPGGKKAVPRIHQSPVLRTDPQNPSSAYALAAMKRPDPIGEGFATEARIESAGPDCIVPGQIPPIRLLGLKVWPLTVIDLKFLEPVGRELQTIGKARNIRDCSRVRSEVDTNQVECHHHNNFINSFVELSLAPWPSQVQMFMDSAVTLMNASFQDR